MRRSDPGAVHEQGWAGVVNLLATPCSCALCGNSHVDSCSAIQVGLTILLKGHGGHDDVSGGWVVDELVGVCDTSA